MKSLPCITNISFFIQQEDPIEEHNEEIDVLSEKIAALHAWFDGSFSSAIIYLARVQCCNQASHI